MGSSAITNTQRKTRRKPKSSVSDFSPYALMGDLLTACSRTEDVEGWRLSATVEGITLTSAPVSMRKRVPVFLSVM